MFLWGHLLKEILAFLMYVPAERTNEAHFFTSTRLICYNSLIVWGPTDKVSFDYISVARSCSWPCVGLVSSITWKWMWRLWGGPVMVILLDFRMLLTICNTNELSAGGEITLWSYLINAGIKNKRTCGEAQMWLRGAKQLNASLPLAWQSPDPRSGWMCSGLSYYSFPPFSPNTGKAGKSLLL